MNPLSPGLRPPVEVFLNSARTFFPALIWSISSCCLVAADHYVDASATNSVAPYIDWSTAAANIQDAVDVSVKGEQVLVASGIYRTGGKVMTGDLTNRVTLDKAITVRSVGGPFQTIIEGTGLTNSFSAVRCAWLTNGALLSGFTLRAGATRNSGTDLSSGGGVWCASSNAIVANCLVLSNAANMYGGGVYRGTLNNCAVIGNKAPIGSGTYDCLMNSCTVVSNLLTGVSKGTLRNCIVYFNPGGNYSGANLSFCCTTPLPPGAGNITTDPLLFEDNLHLGSGSPCRAAGTNLTTGTDLFDQAWADPPSIGCAQWQPLPAFGKVTIKLNSDPVGFTLSAALTGEQPFTYWWMKDGAMSAESGPFAVTQPPDRIQISFNSIDPGGYQLVASNVFGAVTSAPVQLTAHYVDAQGQNPLPPYLGWNNAATSIQDAIDAAAPGEIVLVTNGVYAAGGKSMDGTITNRVAVNKAILVQSVNGPGSTIILGAWDPAATNGAAAIRCAWLTTNAILSGFTLQGGATRGISNPTTQAMRGGGVWGATVNATVCNSVIVGNFASDSGGGAYQVTLNQCAVRDNHAFGSGRAGTGLGSAGSGGGAAKCILKSSLVISNYAHQADGGGALACNSVNCAFVGNRAPLSGSGAYQGTLRNCTLVNNTSGGYGTYGGAAASATLTNCIVYGNFNIGPGSTNYLSCTFSYSDADPLPSGIGNIDADPQLLPDGVHLMASSPCLGTGTPDITSGFDIDGQVWSSPPSMGCDEWMPAPLVAVQPHYQIQTTPPGLVFEVAAAGQLPLTYYWSKDGVLIADDANHTGFGSAKPLVKNLSPDDAGLYQVVVSNSFGVVTSQVGQVVIHVVDAAGANPSAPYSTWATAAATIQDATDSSGPGDIVLVTNGVYATGGRVVAGDLTNRVAVDKSLTVMSVGGYSQTIIEGARDNVSTNGPGAVRCVYLADGARLSGFTLRNGATRTSGDEATLQSGGGAWCASANAIVSNCVLSNNTAVCGGGISYGTIKNSLLFLNIATYGGGAYLANLNNCTVINNYTDSMNPYRGAGTYGGLVRNCIVIFNYDHFPRTIAEDNYPAFGSAPRGQYSFSCTYPPIPGGGNISHGGGNINSGVRLLDVFHIATGSPCRGAGSAQYATGADLDGEPWSNPPSIGCDEVILENLVGPLSVTLRAYQTNLLVKHSGLFSAQIDGRAASLSWSFGVGSTVTNSETSRFHSWLIPGDYTVTCIVYNNDNPDGVSASTVVHVQSPRLPELLSATVLTNGFQFSISCQTNASYTVQYTTNLEPPVVWQDLQTFYSVFQDVQQFTDPGATNEARFYRVLAF